MRTTILNRESNRVDRWIKEAIHIRKEQYKSMNRDEVSYQLSNIYDNPVSYTHLTLPTNREV